MSQSIQLYTDKVIVEADGNTTSATLMDVDIAQLAGQVNIKDMLDNYEFSDVHDYVMNKLKEEE